jgi:hypothetical protein
VGRRVVGRTEHIPLAAKVARFVAVRVLLVGEVGEETDPPAHEVTDVDPAGMQTRLWNTHEYVLDLASVDHGIHAEHVARVPDLALVEGASHLHTGLDRLHCAPEGETAIHGSGHLREAGIDWHHFPKFLLVSPVYD